MDSYEHALFLLLLLGCLLKGVPNKNRTNLYLIAGSLLLVSLPPFVTVEIPWKLVLALTLPWIFWQNARNWLQIDLRLSRRDAYLWLITALCLVLIVFSLGKHTWIRAIFFGIVTASMVWHVSSRERNTGPLGSVGPLTLVFMLMETPRSLDAPLHFVSNLLSGAGVGIAISLLSMVVMKKISSKYEGLISLGQAYLGYLTALAIGASAVAAALIGIVAFTEFHESRLGINEPMKGSVLSNDGFTFISLGLFIFTAWQTYQSATLSLWLEADLGLFIGLWITFLGWHMGLPRFEHLSSAWHIALQLSLLLLGSLILWAHGPELESLIPWFALGSAIFILALSPVLLSSLRFLNVRLDENFPHD